MILILLLCDDVLYKRISRDLQVYILGVQLAKQTYIILHLASNYSMFVCKVYKDICLTEEFATLPRDSFMSFTILMLYR